MRVMEWNIRHGSTRDKLSGMINSIKEHNPDIICLLEFRQERIIELSLALASNGWPYILSSQPPQNTNGILIAAKKGIEAMPGEKNEVAVPHRWLEVRPIRSDLCLLAVQVPSVQDLKLRMDFWEGLQVFATKVVEEGRRAVIIGDLSTGLELDSEGQGFIGEGELRSILDMGWKDVWREYHQSRREYNWYSSQGKGFRLDHVLVSPNIDRPVWAKYSHQERLDGISDHSPLIFDLADRVTEEGSIQRALR